MLNELPERIMIFLINIFCPPLAVMVIAGPSTDCLINTFFFIAGVLPGHIHGFYLTCTYFSRKRKVRKGRYPGGRKAGIYSERVWNGGASNAKVKALWEKRQREADEKLESRRGGGRDWLGRKGTGSTVTDGSNGLGRSATGRERTVGRRVSSRR